MNAPTEEEIRESIRLRTMLYGADNPLDKLKEAVGDLADFMGGPSFDVLESVDPPTERDEADDIWTDLRPSEARDLDVIYRAAVDEAVDAAYVVIVDRLTAAGLAFAREHPDAPRAKPELVTA